MLNKIKKHVYPMLETLEEAVNYFLAAPEGSADMLLPDIASFIGMINDAVKEESLQANQHAEELLDLLPRCRNAQAYDQLQLMLAKYIGAVKAIPVQYKVVFLPNYDNTWDSLESVYEAFAGDPMFVTEIVIIPIRRNVPGGFTHVYSDYLTPKGIPNTHYDEYSFETDQPDFVFYNNPYDGVNYPKFQFRNIKPHVGKMIYVPYALVNYFHMKPKEKVNFIDVVANLPGHDSADWMIMQSNALIELCETSRNKHKMLPLGSPKADNMYVRKKDENWEKPLGWEQALHGKCVLMLNTHYSMFSSVNTWSESYFTAMECLFNIVENNEDLSLIWRPHPQTFFMQGKMNGASEKFSSLCLRAVNHERIVLDRTPSALSALSRCDAVISQYSSIISEALFLDKPIFCLNIDPLNAEEDEPYIKGRYNREYANALKLDERTSRDYRSIFDVMDQIGINRILSEGENFTEEVLIEPLRAFIKNICQGIDFKKEDRESYRKQQFANSNGTCGKKIVSHVKRMIAVDTV